MKRMISLICIAAMLVATLAAFPVFAEDPEVSALTFVGYQYTKDYEQDGVVVRDVRFVAAGTDLTYQSVGFHITSGSQTWDKTSTQVYGTLRATEPDGSVVEIPASAYDAEYLYAFVIQSVPADVIAAFEVKPYAIAKDDSQEDGNSGAITLAKSEPAAERKYDIPADAATFDIDEETYTVIRNVAELKAALSAATDNGRYILGGNIDCGGAVIGAATLFVGKGSVLEGNNCKLYNYNGNGIFNLWNGEEIVIRNLSIGSERNPIVTTATAGGNGVGIVSGYTNSVTRWENCNVYADFTVTDGGNVALWLGAAKGTHTFVNCNSYGSVTSTNNSGAWVGYVWDGETSLTFEKCTNEATIQGKNAGGFVANVYGQVGNEVITFTDCTNKGTVSGECVGGFMGVSNKNVTFIGCVNEIAVTGTGNAGGFIGMTGTASNTKVTIVSCSNNGSVSSSGSEAAGFIANNGYTECSVSNSVNRGTVTAAKNAGGFLGYNAAKLTVENCLNAGTISGAHTAGIVGRFDCAKGVTISGSANIGNIRQIVGEGSAPNIGGYATSGLTMTDCYGFGYLEATKYPGIMVCQYSSVTTFSGNKYFEFGNTTASTTIGLDADSKVATLEEAVALLEARFTDLGFEIVDGRIVLS